MLIQLGCNFEIFFRSDTSFCELIEVLDEMSRFFTDTLSGAFVNATDNFITQ